MIFCFPCNKNRNTPEPSFRGLLQAILLVMVLAFPAIATTQTPIIEIEIKSHLFIPSRIEVPANQKIKLVIYNRDSTSEEFESYELNREKIIMGGRRAIIFIGPLAPGEYPFFGEFYPKTAQGVVVVKEVE